MSAVPPRVVLLIADALPARHVGVELTPHLVELGGATGAFAGTAEASMSTATYPNHATFASGMEPAEHGVVTNRLWNGDKYVAMRQSRLSAPTFLDVAADPERTSMVAGDASIVTAMGADRFERAWPPVGWTPSDDAPDLAVDEYGYVTNEVVVAEVERQGALDAEVAVIHLNDPDTACHVYGPDSDTTAQRIRACDERIGELVDLCRSDRWNETVLIVVSDHDQEEVDPHDAIDLAAAIADSGRTRSDLHIEYEGTAALLGTPGQPQLDGLTTHLQQLGAIDGASLLDDGRALVWTPPGLIFSPNTGHGLRGAHGSPRTAAQVAVVSGGHRSAARLADRLRRFAASPTSTSIRGADWARTIASLRGVGLPSATGRDLTQV